jgi:hypothetical protein
MDGTQQVVVMFLVSKEMSAPLGFSFDARTASPSMGRVVPSLVHKHQDTVSQQQTNAFGRTGSTGGYHVSTLTLKFLKDSCLCKKSGNIPYFTSRAALTHELFHLVIELRPSTTAMGLSENIKRQYTYQ